jgi:hypothetical protein
MQEEVKAGRPEEVEKHGFDLQTHYWDNKSKRLSHKNPYRMHAIDGVQYWERPVGSCNLFYKNDEPAGRLDLKKMKVLPEAEHIEWEAPKTAAELREVEFHDAKRENAELRKELEQIRKENEVKAKPASKPVGDKNGIKASNASGVKPGLGGDSSAAQ